MDNVKPTFGATSAVSPENVDNVRKLRPELGAIWERSTKKGAPYLNIRLKMTKELLKELLDSTPEGNLVPVNLVAFTNKNKEDNPKRPSFRIYQEIPRPASNNS